MATHFSVLDWRIPGMAEPGGLPIYGVAQTQTQLKQQQQQQQQASLVVQLVKNPPAIQEISCNAKDLGLNPGLGKSPGEGNGNPTPVFLPGNALDRGTWWATNHCVTRVGHNLAAKPPP